MASKWLRAWGSCVGFDEVEFLPFSHRRTSSSSVPFSFRQPPTSQHRHHGERTRRPCRPVRFPHDPLICVLAPSTARPPSAQKETHTHTRGRQDRQGLTYLERAVTSPASAAPPTASSRPRTTALFRSASPRSMRTADSLARPRPTPSAASFAPWASPTTASTASLSVTATSRTSGAPADKRLA